MIAVYGSGSPIMPAAVSPASRRRSSTSARRVRARRVAAVAALLRHDDDEQALAVSSSASAFALSASSSSSPLAVRLATASVMWNDRPSVSMSATTCSTGSPEAWWTRSTRSRRSQPERGSRVGRDHDRVGVVLADRVHRRRVRVRVADLADRVHALRAHEPDREFDAAPGRRRRRRRRRRRSPSAAASAARRARTASAPRPRGGGPPRSAAVRRSSRWPLRGWSSCFAPPGSRRTGRLRRRRPDRAASAGGLKMPCTAPGTPYSYGPPTTGGTASKLKIGGGEETCHSSVSAAPRVGRRARPAAPAGDHVVEEDQRAQAPRPNEQIEMNRFQSANLAA